MSKYQPQKEYYSQAYRTGSDFLWTHTPREHRGADFVRFLPKNALVLDVGSGRGLWALELAKRGFRVVGIDYVGEALASAREFALDAGVADRVRFVEADVLGLTIQEATFDGITDFGLFHSLLPEDWELYKQNIARVLKPGGLFFVEVNSKETSRFLNVNPKASEESRFEKYGVSYHFFGEDEIRIFFADAFEAVAIVHEYPKGRGEGKPALLSCLFRKK